MKFILASTNKNKLREFKEILLPLGVEIFTADVYGFIIPDIEEVGTTFAENAKLKALTYLQKTNMPVIADDSGLMVDALNGEPGIYSARYADTAGDRIQKVLNKLINVPDEARTAKFVTAICCLFPDGKIIEVQGEGYGKIGYKPIGTNGFGYDPIFITSNGKTYAELTSEEKNEISHRGNALRKFRSELEKLLRGANQINDNK